MYKIDYLFIISAIYIQYFVARWRGSKIGQNSFSRSEYLLEYLLRLSVRLVQRFIAFFSILYVSLFFKNWNDFFLDEIPVMDYLHDEKREAAQFCSQLLYGKIFRTNLIHRQSCTRRVTLEESSRFTFFASPAFWFVCGAPEPHRRPPRQGCDRCSCA